MPGARPWTGIRGWEALLGAYGTIEQRLFEVLGAFASGEPVAEAAVLFDALSQQHAWHAALLAEQVPQIPPGEGTAADAGPALVALDRLAALERAPARLAGLARVVLPRGVAGYRRQLETVRELADAPVRRALRLVVRDEVEAQLGAEMLLEALLADGAEPEVFDQVRAVEEPLVTGGPGLVRWP